MSEVPPSRGKYLGADESLAHWDEIADAEERGWLGIDGLTDEQYAELQWENDAAAGWPERA